MRKRGLMSTKAADLIKHYLALTLEHANIVVDADVRTELASIAGMLEDEMRDIAQEEIRFWVDNISDE